MALSTVVRALILFILSTLVCSQTATSPHTATAETTTENSTADDVWIQEAARLKEALLNRSVVRQKVPPRTSFHGGKVQVNVFMSLASILDVDDSQQIVTSSFLFGVSWQDRSLSWSAQDHGGQEEVEMVLDSIWIPSVLVMNSPLFTDILSHAQHMVVDSNGAVVAYAAITRNTVCNLDHTQFPFDTQLCYVVVYSFSDAVSVDVHPSVVDSSTSSAFLQKSSWELMSVGKVRLLYGPEKIPVMQMELRRGTTFYIMCLVTPMVLTSYANTLVFLVPLQSGEKVSFLVTLFVSTSVYVSFFSEVMPRSLDSVPSTMKLLLGVIVETLVVLLATLIVMKRFHSEQKDAEDTASPVPPCDQTVDGNATNTAGCSSVDTEGLPRVMRAAPVSEATVQTEDVHAGGGGKQPGKTHITAVFLDRVFFALVFVANTVFLFVLLCE